MPTYTYKCEKCHHIFDVIQKMSDDSLKDCPRCNDKEVLKKLINNTGGFQLKGSGWFNSGGY